MVTSGAQIQYSDLVALATLANAKLSPSTPYSFPAFGGKNEIALPSDIKPVATYGGTGAWPAGEKATLWIYGYKTIAGTKTYTWTPLVKAFYPVAASGDYSLTWSWTNPIGTTAPEGYIIAVPFLINGGWEFWWQDIGLVETFTEDGTFSNPAWKIDTTLEQTNDGFPAQNLPCGHGAWLKPMNQIHSDLFNGMDLFGGSSITFDPSFLLSGPWCVSAAQKCYLYINSTSVYNNLEFWYSEADSATGNELAPEADMRNQYTGGVDGLNSFDWTQNVIVKGRMVLMSIPDGQAPADWTLSASPGITPSFDPNYNDPVNGLVTGLIFDFDDVPYTVGTPLAITATPHTGAHVINTGNPAGGGLFVNCVFTGDSVVYGASDTTAIHYAGIAVKKVSLASSLTAITFTTAIGGSNVLESHHRSFCNGVFVANTLPTLGLMTYLDQDLPQYNNPSPPSPELSSRRVALSDSLPYIPHVDNRGALWPVFRDTDFTPDNISGQAFNGSAAWQGSICTKYIQKLSVTSTVPPSGLSSTITVVQFIFIGATPPLQVRILADNPNVTFYVKVGSPPTITDFDFNGIGGVWKNQNWGALPTLSTLYIGILNPTAAPVQVTTRMLQMFSLTEPDGTFFPTIKDDDGNTVPLHEAVSYHWWDNKNTDLLPIPLLGYCVNTITIRRQPVDNGSGIMIAPSTGTTALNVDIGIMAGYGFDTAGTFQKIQTITIPAGSASASQQVFLPSLSGTLLAYQCPE